MTTSASVIIPAFNLAHFLPAAIESALAQEIPGGAVEIIVVDDGSTDETPEVLARYSDRVRVVRQPNRGLVGAVDRGLAEVQGQFVALLDADDEWPRGRLRRHIEILDRNPTVGLVHGDMEMIGREGQVYHPSFFELKRIQPTDGRVLGRLLCNNFVSGGASTFRASLLPAIRPITPDAAYPDWSIAACIAAVAEIAFDPVPSNRYRYHGANMGLDAAPERQPSIHRRELPWRRWMMWHLADDETVSATDLLDALAAWRFGVGAAAADPAESGGRLGLDPASAAALLGAASPHSAPDGKTLMRAFSRNPADELLGAALEAVLCHEAQLPQRPPAPPLIALETRPRLILAWLEEILRAPDLLSRFAAGIGEDEASLAVLARPGDDITPLIALVEADERLSGEDCDITVLTEPGTTPARSLLAARAYARLTATPCPEAFAGVPVHDAVTTGCC